MSTGTRVEDSPDGSEYSRMAPDRAVAIGAAIQVGERALTGEAAADRLLLPVLDQQVRGDSPPPQELDRAIEPGRIERVPPHDHPTGVIAHAAAVLHGEDHRIGRSAGRDVEGRLQVAPLAGADAEQVAGVDEPHRVRSRRPP